MAKEQADRSLHLAAQRHELRRAVDEQAHARGEEAAQAVLRLVDRELDRSKNFGGRLSEHDCDELHLCALRGFLEGLRDDLVDTVGIDHAVTRRLAIDVFRVDRAQDIDGGAPTPGQQAIEDAYDALLALGIGPDEPSDELVAHLGDYIVQVIAAAARHDRGDGLLVEGRLLRSALVRLLARMAELPDIGLACAHAALAEGKAAFERRLVEAERASSEESARVIELAMCRARHRQPRSS
jgi:hypothetical protein